MTDDEVTLSNKQQRNKINNDQSSLKDNENSNVN